MKCFFCNKRCRLLKDKEPDFRQSEMTWLCNSHPTRVLHHVHLERYNLRRDHSIQGVERTWNHSTVKWVNDKGQIMEAWFRRNEDRQPADFIVHVVRKGKERWQDKYDEVFTMDHYPEGFTPENIAQKVATFVIFS